MIVGKVCEIAPHITSRSFRLITKQIATHFQITAFALKSLAMLVHDDFNLVVPVLPRILVRVLQVGCFKPIFSISVPTQHT